MLLYKYTKIFLKLLRFIICVTLTMPLWIIVVFFAALFDARDCPTPKSVYVWLKDSLTKMVNNSVSFIKNEIF